ncbi:hypothetical protein AB4Y72_08485 [Arthrobacter sp. YAF34]|uniref:hypothetical protein n=1 Tax=Arthrobacter sp. YAF34 TaxID=3233083 RepID=UPI003F8F8C16
MRISRGSARHLRGSDYAGDILWIRAVGNRSTGNAGTVVVGRAVDNAVRNNAGDHIGVNAGDHDAGQPTDVGGAVVVVRLEDVHDVGRDAEFRLPGRMDRQRPGR